MIAGVKRASQLVADTLAMIQTRTVPGMRTQDLDKICTAYIVAQGGRSGCKGYKGYPKNICVSINEVACHGIPGPRVIQPSDLVNIDIVVELDGYYGDGAITIPMPECSSEARQLSEVTRKARDHAISLIRPGITTGDIGHAIESYVQQHSKFSIVRGYCGHGIGTQMHQPPSVPNYGLPGSGMPITSGMCFTVEPIVAMGKPEVRELADGWTVVTCDGSWTAQWEHTIVVTDAGCEVCTVESDKYGERVAYNDSMQRNDSTKH
jgi:methionyl aminopeptidase